MLEWKIKTGDEKLKEEIQYIQNTFDSWFNAHWARKCTREKMLSEDSPVEHVYYKMTKSFEKIKEKYPYDALQKCSSCKKQVDKWIEAKVSFCDEYDCGIYLCKKCANKLKKVIEKL